MSDTLNNLADYHYVSLSVINRMKARGVDVHDHMAVEAAILRQHNRPGSWVNGNPNRHGVKFPQSSKLKERERLVCYCDKKGTCVSCKADLDYGCKYFDREH